MNYWTTLCKGYQPYFYNSQPIHGIKKIDITFKQAYNNFKIYYSPSSSFDDDHVISYTTSVSSLSCNFNNFLPNYFKFVSNNTSTNISITEMAINFSCINVYYDLKVQSNDETKGTITTDHTGLTKVGTEVNINATPINGYKFVEWQKNGVKVSDSASYSFTMSNEDSTYIAIFE